LAWYSNFLKKVSRRDCAVASDVIQSRSRENLSFARVVLAASTVVAISSVGEAASGCRNEEFRENSYTVCSFDSRVDDLRIFWQDQGGAPFRTFSALGDEITSRNGDLAFAINGGMYQEDFSPIGLLIVAGVELRRANTVDIAGDVVPNFYKKPNGVFFIGDGKVGVMETELFLATQPEATFATQSGPMLVIDGKIHPAFIEGSPSRKPRNGVGVSSSSEVHFVLSQGSVNFDQFARFFRDRLGADNALFLDGGSAPGIFAPDLGRNDPPAHGGYGPIIGVVGEKLK